MPLILKQGSACFNILFEDSNLLDCDYRCYWISDFKLVIWSFLETFLLLLLCSCTVYFTSYRVVFNLFSSLYLFVAE